MKKIVLPLLLCALLLVVGCSAPKNSMYEAQSAPTAPMAAPAPMAAAPMADTAMDMAGGWGEMERASQEKALAGGETGSAVRNTSAKIIKTAGLSLQSREFDAHVSYIRQKVEAMGGYVSDSYVSGRKPEVYGDPGRYAAINVRVPQESLEAFLADARGLATVIQESSGGNDITAAYFDTESRLEIYTAQKDRILALMKQADKMEDIIVLETELSRLTYEIENLTGSLRQWDDLVDYATVNISIDEIPSANVTTVSSDSVGVRISEGFSRTLSGVGAFFENLFVFIIVSSPVLLIMAAIAVVILLIVRRNMKKRQEKGELYTPPQYMGSYGGDGRKTRKERKGKMQQEPETKSEE